MEFNSHQASVATAKDILNAHFSDDESNPALELAMQHKGIILELCIALMEERRESKALADNHYRRI